MINPSYTEVIDNALEACDKCYYAMNDLAVKTRVDFSFAATDLYNTRQFLRAWSENLHKYDINKEEDKPF